MKRNDVFPSGYFKVEHFNDGNLTLTIKHTTVKTIGQGADAEEKPHLAFEEDPRELALNVTNWNLIADVYGDESDDWNGHQITLFKTRVPYAGKMVDAIRVEAPNPLATPNAAPAASTRAPEGAAFNAERFEAQRAAAAAAPQPDGPPMTAGTRAQIIAQARILWPQNSSDNLGKHLAPHTFSELRENMAKDVLAALQRKTREAQPAPKADDFADGDSFEDGDPFGD